MTPTRVRGNSFPRALFLFFFAFFPGVWLDLELIWNFFRKYLVERPVAKMVGQTTRLEGDDHMVSKDNTNYSEILQIKNELN